MTASKNAKKKRGRPFEAGHPGGPGRPAGSRNRATLALDKMAEGEAKEIAQKMFEAAKAGDMRAAELVLARVWPVRRGRPVSIALPSIESAPDVVQAIGLIANAVAAGELTPEEGQAVASVLEVKRRAIETVELENRVQSLENERKGK